MTLLIVNLPFELCDESLQWLNSTHKINVILTSLQCFLNLPTSNTNISDKQTKDLRLLLLYVKQYHYVCIMLCLLLFVGHCIGITGLTNC